MSSPELARFTLTFGPYSSPAGRPIAVGLAGRLALLQTIADGGGVIGGTERVRIDAAGAATVSGLPLGTYRMRWDHLVAGGPVDHLFTVDETHGAVVDYDQLEAGSAPGEPAAPAGHTHVEYAPTGHTHDLTGYVTDEELAAALAGIDTGAASEHTHPAPDLTGYATSGHTHPAPDLTGYATSGHTHPAPDLSGYVTDDELADTLAGIGTSEPTPGTIVRRNELGEVVATFASVSEQPAQPWNLTRRDWVEGFLGDAGTATNEFGELARRDEWGVVAVTGLSIAAQPVGAWEATRKDYVDAQVREVATATNPGIPTLWALGDSLTEIGQVNIWDTSRSWHWWAQHTSGGRFIFEGYAATGGYSPAQILATHVPTVVAAAPTYCTVLAGQNQPYQLDELRQIWETLRDAGIIPILCTNVPSSGTSDPGHLALNQYIRRYALREGLPLVDLNRAMMDPLTGLPRAGLTSDGAHQTGEGAKVMGDALAEVITDLIPLSPADLVAHDVPDDPAGTGYLSGNPLLLRDMAGVPHAWSAFAPGSYTLGADPACLGRKWTVTATGGTAVMGYVLPDLTPGHRIQLGFMVGAEVETVGGGWGYRMTDAADNSMAVLFRVTTDLPWGSIVWREFVVPTDAGPGGWTFDIFVEQPGSAVAIAQFTVRDLTALGTS